MPQIKVLIVGAGLGGLCLAQSLRNAHIDFEVFERDLSPWDRPQGYRLHLEADALNALREVLPPDLHRLFEATAMRTNPFTTILKQDFTVLKRIPTDDGQDAQYWPQFASEEKTTATSIAPPCAKSSCSASKTAATSTSHCFSTMPRPRASQSPSPTGPSQPVTL